LKDVWGLENPIPYWDLAPKLFKSNGEQEIIPFLGAGVSVSDRAEKEPVLAPLYPDDGTVNQVANLLKLEGEPRLYLEYAIRTAVRMQAWLDANGAEPSRDEFLKKLKANQYPPFAWELSELFGLTAPYHSFNDRALKTLHSRNLLPPEKRVEVFKDRLLSMLKLLSTTTDLASATDPLSSISSYYESNRDRPELWDRLRAVVAFKETPTRTHRLIADAAALHLEPEGAEDYLIITTNYDWLMEKALDEKGIPYVVLWRSRKDRKIHARFGNLAPEEQKKAEARHQPADPNLFSLKMYRDRGLVVIYKMHGCLYKELGADDDGLVVTDSDYVEFISQLQSIIPAHVGQAIGKKRFLFLGYSFSDWNVRSIYESMTARPGREVILDYAVSRSLSGFEQIYFKKREITIVLTDLASFTAGIRNALEAANP